jgi:hypothetical protein
MPKTTDLTAEDLDAQAHEAQVQASALSQKARAIREAGAAAARAARLETTRRQYESAPMAAAAIRNAAAAELERVAAVEPFDLLAVAQAFLEVQIADQTAQAIGNALPSALDQLDRLPGGVLGVARSRPKLTPARYDKITLAGYLSDRITDTARRAASRALGKLRDEVDAAAEQAEAQARAQASRSVDGHLDVDVPESIKSRYDAAVAKITEADIEAWLEQNPGKGRGSGYTVLKQNVLDQLLAAEKADNVESITGR